MILNKAIAIIPARGGSRRIPRKNIRPFLGRPIISYSIRLAINSGLFDEVMVSTDDSEIKRVAMEYGAAVPFFRSSKNSDDFATTADVILEVLGNYQKSGRNFDFACCIYPTAPLIQQKRLEEGVNLLIKQKRDVVFPVMRYSYPIQRALKFSDDKIMMIDKRNIRKRSQDLLDTFHDAGQFYWLRVESFLIKKNLITDNTGAIVISGVEGQDIDDIRDWELAELKYKLIQNTFKNQQ